MNEEARTILSHRVEEVLRGARRHVILHVDARELSQIIPINRIHVLLSDVPYGVSSSDITLNGGRELALDFQEMKPHQVDQMVRAAVGGLIPAVVSDGLAYLWCADRQFGMLYDLLATWGFQPGFLAWTKPNPPPSVRKSTWVSAAELCVRGRRKSAPFFWEVDPEDEKKQHLNFNTIPLGCRAHPSGHPNEKPVELMLRILRKHIQPGEIVLDPFCGSGAIGEAALTLGARYIGADISKRWVEYSDARLSALPHFDPARIPAREPGVSETPEDGTD